MMAVLLPAAMIDTRCRETDRFSGRLLTDCTRDELLAIIGYIASMVGIWELGDEPALTRAFVASFKNSDVRFYHHHIASYSRSELLAIARYVVREKQESRERAEHRLVMRRLRAGDW